MYYKYYHSSLDYLANRRVPLQVNEGSVPKKITYCASPIEAPAKSFPYGTKHFLLETTCNCQVSLHDVRSDNCANVSSKEVALRFYRVTFSHFARKEMAVVL